MPELSAIQALLQKHGQSHLLRWWDELSPAQQSSLLEQIDELDLELVNRLFRQKDSDEVSPAERAALATPPAQLVAQPKTAAEAEQWRQATALGEEQLRQGCVGAILVAGGQGSRLGFDKPKGM